MKYYTLTAIDKADKVELEKMLVTHLNKEEGEQLMTSLARHWEEEGITKGRLEGIEKGIEVTALDMLRQNCDIKFITKVTGLSVVKISELKEKL